MRVALETYGLFPTQTSATGLSADIGFGIVGSAYIDDQGREAPAHARVELEGDPDVPMIWVHNDRALGENLGPVAYDHWEAMTTGGSQEIANEWGLPTPSVGMDERLRRMREEGRCWDVDTQNVCIDPSTDVYLLLTL